MLSDTQKRILALEEEMPHPSGLKEDRMRELVPRRVDYFRLLNRAIDDPEALAADPLLVKRLLRRRARLVQKRASRILG